MIRRLITGCVIASAFAMPGGAAASASRVPASTGAEAARFAGVAPTPIRVVMEIDGEARATIVGSHPICVRPFRRMPAIGRS
ncbi:hypothetical protein [Sphingomonas sp.]|uniref:hypothetical protein n=1 Tax=Sphingomonas sp. TaxID=28214 RepID=UPI001ED2543A|nr:hypothetical protein [Sphingomonas sp.]MBX3593668.1 hypothetical protein [Sphingomonas sp.]